MKIDADIKIKTPKGDLSVDEIITVAVDFDYCSDCDDIIRSIENDLYEQYGVSMYNDEDFTITNYSELCNEFINDVIYE